MNTGFSFFNLLKIIQAILFEDTG